MTQYQWWKNCVCLKYLFYEPTYALHIISRYFTFQSTVAVNLFDVTVCHLMKLIILITSFYYTLANNQNQKKREQTTRRRRLNDKLGIWMKRLIEWIKFTMREIKPIFIIIFKMSVVIGIMFDNPEHKHISIRCVNKKKVW